MAKRNFIVYDKDYNILNEGDIVIFADTNGTLHKREITSIVAKYVIPTDIPQCDNIKYSVNGIGIKREPTDTLLYIDMGDYATPCVVSSRKTYKYFKK